MKYIITDNDFGYRLEVRTPADNLIATHDEMGGHGLIEEAYGLIDKLSHKLEHNRRQELRYAAAVYRGYGGFHGVRVTVERPGGLSAEIPLTHWTRHSPTGFSWGYGGSGPSELARCILLDHFLNTRKESLTLEKTGSEWALPVDYHQFKNMFVIQWPWNEDTKPRDSKQPAWVLTSNEIERWVVMFAQAAPGVKF